MTYTEFIIGIENNIAKANCNKLNMEEYEEKQKQIYKQIRAEVIGEVNKKLDELERNYESCYGAKIVEMYADTYEAFRKWLKEQK